MKTWFPLIEHRLITIRAHYTWLLFLMLGTWTFARLILPQRIGADGSLWLPAAAIMILYVLSVAVHEAAHVIVARLLRAPMPTLNVHPIGVLARLGREAFGPGRTFAIAAAGPLANLLIWWLLQTSTGALTDLTTASILEYTAMLNLGLALINLLPGLPLDGGRMLRAAVWAGTDFWAGTRFATITGYIVVAAGFFVGLRSLTEDTWVRGLWIILLAWLIYSAGTALHRRRIVATMFDRLTAQDVMQPAASITAPSTTLRTLVQSWRGRSGENATPVIDHGKLVGLITASLAHDVPQGYWDERAVGQTMLPVAAVRTVTPDMSLAEVLPLLDRNEFHPLPLFVVEAGRLLGEIDAREVTALLEVQTVLGLHRPVAPPEAEEPAQALTVGGNERVAL